MSFIVTCNDEEIWSPSLTVGGLYYGQILLIEKILNETSGVTLPFDDELEIDSKNFEQFINNCLKFLQNTNNYSLISLFSGCVEVSIYLNYLAQGKWIEVPVNLTFLSENAKKLASPI